MQYLLFDGMLRPADAPFAGIDNRSFRYGDGLFETICIKNRSPLLLKEHFHRIETAARILQLSLPVFFDNHFLKEQIQVLWLANGEPSSARCRLVVWRKGDGTYLPIANEVSWLLAMYEDPAVSYRLHEIAALGFYDEVLKPVNILSPFKTTSALLYVLASVYMQEHALGECVLLNERGEVCEGTSSNIWLVRDGCILTPRNESGCVQGVMRAHLLGVLPGCFKVQLTDVGKEDLDTADEIFFTNAAGIRSVQRWNGRPLDKKIATQCVAILNKSLGL